MLIINADDWGGWKSATDAALACFEKNRITSVSAMVFMEDSERAAELAKVSKIDVGLHVNLNQHFTGLNVPQSADKNHRRVSGFLKSSKYAQLLYNPFLARAFRSDYEAQLNEFERLYGRKPSHFDGHQHMHLCANMLWPGIIPRGQKIRRSFSFWPGEKSLFNRAYRGVVDKWVEARNRTTSYFFSLAQCIQFDRLNRVANLAKAENVELMTHPEVQKEFEYLCSERYLEMFEGIRKDCYASL